MNSNELFWQKSVAKRILEEKRQAFIIVMFASDVAESYDCSECHAERVIFKAMENADAVWSETADLISSSYDNTEICPISELLDATSNKPTKKKPTKKKPTKKKD